jgi:hypothetical protein
MTDAHAAHLTALRTAVLARLLREALPTAATLVVDTGPWYYAENHGGGSVLLLAVLDEGNTLLWADQHRSEPEVTGGWAAVREEIESGLLACLAYATPARNGWTELPMTTIDLHGLDDVPDTDVQVIDLQHIAT